MPWASLQSMWLITCMTALQVHDGLKDCWTVHLVTNTPCNCMNTGRANPQQMCHRHSVVPLWGRSCRMGASSVVYLGVAMSRHEYALK